MHALIYDNHEMDQPQKKLFQFTKPVKNQTKHCQKDKLNLAKESMSVILVLSGQIKLWLLMMLLKQANLLPGELVKIFQKVNYIVTKINNFGQIFLFKR